MHTAGCLLALQLWATTAATGQQAATATPPDNAGRTACPLEPGPTRAVTAVIDGGAVMLDDGTEIRLIGALTPRPPDTGLDIAFWPPEREAKSALEQLVLGRSVTLGFSGRRSDRYGRTQAHLFVDRVPAATGETAAEPLWVQAALLSAGHARAYVLKDNPGCLRELSAHEALARAEKKGLWAHAAYQIRDAADTAGLMRLRSTFQLVSGVVTKVIVTKTSTILRFGAEDDADRTGAAGSGEMAVRTPRGFSVAIKPSIVRLWSADGIGLDQVEGRRLRIRGWIERRGGPAIEIIDPQQIELDEAGAENAVIAERPPRRRRSRRE